MKLARYRIQVHSYPILYWGMAKAHSGRKEATKRALGMQIRVKSKQEMKCRRIKVTRSFIQRQGKEVHLMDSLKIEEENLYLALQRRHQTEE